MRGHYRFEAVAGRDGHHLAGLPGKQFANLAGIAPAHRDPGQDQRSGVDLVRIYIGVLVLARDEGTQRLSINVLGRRIGCEQNIGLIERLSGRDDIAAVESFQDNSGEYEMGGGRADIHADAQDDDLVLLDQRATRAGEKNSAAALLLQGRHAPTNFGTAAPFL